MKNKKRIKRIKRSKRSKTFSYPLWENGIRVELNNQNKAICKIINDILHEHDTEEEHKKAENKIGRVILTILSFGFFTLILLFLIGDVYYIILNKFNVDFRFYILIPLLAGGGFQYLLWTIGLLKNEPRKAHGNIIYIFLTIIGILYSAEYLIDLLTRLGLIK